MHCPDDSPFFHSVLCNFLSRHFDNQCSLHICQKKKTLKESDELFDGAFFIIVQIVRYYNNRLFKKNMVEPENETKEDAEVNWIRQNWIKLMTQRVQPGFYHPTIWNGNNMRTNATFLYCISDRSCLNIQYLKAK